VALPYGLAVLTSVPAGQAAPVWRFENAVKQQVPGGFPEQALRAGGWERDLTACFYWPEPALPKQDLEPAWPDDFRWPAVRPVGYCGYIPAGLPASRIECFELWKVQPASLQEAGLCWDDK
jgi:hypothetical protein